MNKREVAATLEEIALLLELAGESPFKVRAYEAGARAVLTLPGDLEEAVRQGELDRVKGIGKSLAGVIAELVDRGEATLHQELRAKTPAGLVELLAVPGLGPKKARVLYEQLNIASLGELEYACQENRLISLPGFGAKTQDQIKAGLESLKRYAGLFRLGDLLPVAEALVNEVRRVPGILRAELAGAVRRRLEVAQEISLVAAAAQPEQVWPELRRLPALDGLEIKGPGQAQVVLAQGVRFQVMLVPPPLLGPRPCF